MRLTHTGPAPSQRNDIKTLKTLLPYLLEFKGRVILALSLLFLAKLANVGVPLLLKDIVDQLSQTQVALALPLYQQARQIRDKLTPILACTLTAVLISVCTTLGVGHLMGADPALLASIATKSITTPLAMSVSQSLGGIPAIAAAVVVVVGILGALIGYPLLRLMRVTDPEAQGLAMGACAHAIGTAASAEQGVTQGAFSSLAMVVCGVLTAAVAPLLFALYHWLT